MTLEVAKKRAERLNKNIPPISRERRSKSYLGDYMPFAGVKFYALLKDIDIARGGNKIGPVGWRRGNDLDEPDATENNELAPAA